jgi:hypothetical protein
LNNPPQHRAEEWVEDRLSPDLCISTRRHFITVGVAHVERSDFAPLGGVNADDFLGIAPGFLLLCGCYVDAGRPRGDPLVGPDNPLFLRLTYHLSERSGVMSWREVIRPNPDGRTGARRTVLDLPAVNMAAFFRKLGFKEQ